MPFSCKVRRRWHSPGLGVINLIPDLDDLRRGGRSELVLHSRAPLNKAPETRFLTPKSTTDTRANILIAYPFVCARHVDTISLRRTVPTGSRSHDVFQALACLDQVMWKLSCFILREFKIILAIQRRNDKTQRRAIRWRRFRGRCASAGLQPTRRPSGRAKVLARRITLFNLIHN